MKYKRLWICLAPFLFALGAILYAYLNAATVAAYTSAIPFLLFDFALIAIFCYPLQRLTHDWYRTSLLLTIGVFGLLTAKNFFLLAGGGTLLVLLLAWGVFKSKRKTFSKDHLIFTLNLSAIATVALLLRVLTIAPWQNDNINYQTIQRPPANWNPPSTAQDLPDIYYIILDGYGRADVLQGLYGYDNTPFIADLQQQGFIVVPQSRANYPRTALSLPSSLNMDYIQNLMPGMEDSPFWWRVSPLISDSRTWEILKEAGYISVAVASDWAPTNNTKADIYLHPKPLHIIGFPAYYIATTPLKIFAPLLSPIAFFTSTSGHRMLINYDFDTLANLPPTSQPKFVFAHIIAPHPPFVFDAQGNPRDPGYPFTFNDGNDFPQSKAVYREAYINQLQYINQRVEDMVESILANATRPTVIIIQSDHGPGLYTDFSSAQNTCLWERLSNFTALYLPGVSPQDVPEDLNAVNIFRLVLNTYLGTDFPMLENRQYYPENPGYIFRLEDVTDEINRPCP